MPERCTIAQVSRQKCIKKTVCEWLAFANRFRGTKARSRRICREKGGGKDGAGGSASQFETDEREPDPVSRSGVPRISGGSEIAESDSFRPSVADRFGMDASGEDTDESEPDIGGIASHDMERESCFFDIGDFGFAASVGVEVAPNGFADLAAESRIAGEENRSSDEGDGIVLDDWFDGHIEENRKLVSRFPETIQVGLIARFSVEADGCVFAPSGNMGNEMEFAWFRRPVPDEDFAPSRVIRVDFETDFGAGSVFSAQRQFPVSGGKQVQPDG